MSKGQLLEEFRVCSIFPEQEYTTGTVTQDLTVRSEGVLLSLHVAEITGTLDVNVYTWTKDQARESDSTFQGKLIDSFPQIVSPTSEILLRKQIEVMDHIRVEYVLTGTAKFNVKAKGVRAGLASVNVLGAGDWQVTNITAPDSGSPASLLIPSSLVGRSGLDIRNANFNTADILQVAETKAKVEAGIYRSVLPGEAFQPALDSGNEVWARSSTGNTIRVEVTEVGDA